MGSPTAVLLVFSVLLPRSAALLFSSASSSSSSEIAATTSFSSLGTVSGLFRHAVKGLSADALTSVQFQQANEAFPDDRRFALLYRKNEGKFQGNDAQWLHKENFLCAFTAPKLFARYRASYQLHQRQLAVRTTTTTTTSSASNRVDDQQLQQSLLSYGSPADCVEVIDASNSGIDEYSVHRWLSLYERATNCLVLGPVDMATESGRDTLADFFALQSGQSVVCVTQSEQQPRRHHTHQFGNTSSGVKLRQGDTRTMHIINAATLRDITARTGVFLNPTRFRPNIVIDGIEAWSEFDWIGKQIHLGSCQMSILARTVRCDGVSIDPLDPDQVVNIPQLLIDHYPQHGPYLGVYAALDVPGTLSLGDPLTLC